MAASDATDEEGRPLDLLLAEYAAGRLSPPLHALVAAHLMLSRKNRVYVDALESLAADGMDAAPCAAPRDRDARLAAVFAAAPPAVRPAPCCGVLPAPVLHLAGMALSDIPWRTRLPGIKEFSIGHDASGEAFLLWARAGRMLPAHTHDGVEATLVLSGGFSDETGHYRRGDIAVADGALDHSPRADDDADCVCFVVAEAPVRLTGPLARLVQGLLSAGQGRRNRPA